MFALARQTLMSSHIVRVCTFCATSFGLFRFAKTACCFFFFLHALDEEFKAGVSKLFLTQATMGSNI